VGEGRGVGDEERVGGGVVGVLAGPGDAGVGEGDVPGVGAHGRVVAELLPTPAGLRDDEALAEFRGIGEEPCVGERWRTAVDDEADVGGGGEKEALGLCLRVGVELFLVDGFDGCAAGREPFSERVVVGRDVDAEERLLDCGRGHGA
jgi:hypothetical protein